jgi:hypothetical protein
MSNYFYRELIPQPNPTTIRVQPILPANQMPDEYTTFETIAGILRVNAFQIARSLYQGNQILTRNQIQNATGWLQMRNIDNNSHAHVENLRLGDLDIFALYDLFDRVHAESNPDLTVYSVIWEFWVNPQSLQFGGARGGPDLDYTCKIANRIYEYDTVRAGCAAVAATVFLVKRLPEHTTLNHHIKRPSSHRKIYDLAMTLQDKLGTLHSNSRLDY